MSESPEAGASPAAFAEGEPCWALAMLPDAEAGRRFYGSLFGWTFDEPGQERHGAVFARLGGRAVASLLTKPDARMPSEWSLHLSTADTAAAAARIRAAGGEVLMESFPVGEAGRTAVAADPGGAVFQLWEPGTHRGFEVTREPGSFVWAEVFTRDPAAVDAFYPEVFGFGAKDLTEFLGTGYVMWTPRGAPVDEAHAIAGRSLFDPGDPADAPAHFLTYFAVRDCDQAVREAAALGGHTVRGAEDSPFGRFAVLADDQGARFAVLGPE